MRFLIVATAILACAAAVPSGLLAGPYGHGLAGHGLVGHGLAGHGLVGHGYAAPLVHAAPALPTISPGDLAGAAIDAHVEQSDHVRAAVDATREYHDQASELQGQAINAAEDHSWQAVDAAKTAQAQLDGAAAGVAPVLAKQLVGHGHAGYAAPAIVGHGAYAAGPAVLGHGAYAAPAVLGHAAYAAGPAVLGHGAYGHGAYGHGGSQTVVSQSLSQTHPGAVVHAAPLGYAHGLGVGHGLGHGIAHGW